MMHGYLAFDADDNLLAPFRTWRNTNTGRAADELTHLFGFNIPCAGRLPTCIRRSSTLRSTRRASLA